MLEILASHKYVFQQFSLQFSDETILEVVMYAHLFYVLLDYNSQSLYDLQLLVIQAQQ